MTQPQNRGETFFIVLPDDIVLNIVSYFTYDEWLLFLDTYDWAKLLPVAEQTLKYMIQKLPYDLFAEFRKKHFWVNDLVIYRDWNREAKTWHHALQKGIGLKHANKCICTESVYLYYMRQTKLLMAQDLLDYLFPEHGGRMRIKLKENDKIYLKTRLFRINLSRRHAYNIGIMDKILTEEEVEIRKQLKKILESGDLTFQFDNEKYVQNWKENEALEDLIGAFNKSDKDFITISHEQAQEYIRKYWMIRLCDCSDIENCPGKNYPQRKGMSEKKTAKLFGSVSDLFVSGNL